MERWIDTVRPDYVVMFGDRQVRFEVGKQYYISYRRGKRMFKFHGVVFEEFSEGMLHFTSLRGAAIELEPNVLVNAL